MLDGLWLSSWAGQCYHTIIIEMNYGWFLLVLSSSFTARQTNRCSQHSSINISSWKKNLCCETSNISCANKFHESHKFPVATNKFFVKSLKFIKSQYLKCSSSCGKMLKIVLKEKVWLCFLFHRRFINNGTANKFWKNFWCCWNSSNLERLNSEE